MSLQHAACGVSEPETGGAGIGNQKQLINPASKKKQNTEETDGIGFQIAPGNPQPEMSQLTGKNWTLSVLFCSLLTRKAHLMQAGPKPSWPVLGGRPKNKTEPRAGSSISIDLSGWRKVDIWGYGAKVGKSAAP